MKFYDVVRRKPSIVPESKIRYKKIRTKNGVVTFAVATGPGGNRLCKIVGREA